MIRFGIIGTNWITEAFIKAASNIEDFELTAVYSRTMERAKEFADNYGVDSLFTDLEEMAVSNIIDAVYIATPNSLHAEQALIFLKHKKHVLCEKPIASNRFELADMIQAAKENDVLLMEAMKPPFLPNFKSVQKNLHKIGKIRRFSASQSQYSSRYDAYKAGTVMNAFKPEFASGSLMDIGIYCIYPVVMLLGRPEKILANGYLLESGADGQGSIIFSYKESEAIISHSKITNSVVPSEIQGENGSILIDKISDPKSVKIVYRDGTEEDITQSQAENTMVYEAMEFIELIKSGKHESDINSFEMSMAVMEIMDEARAQIGLKYPGDR
ncbi:gfo/Idh/MocA family oxidoreductase [Peribacillus saganii]|uniref:Gfo/Idh/MocA family oxidoreductase n=1 Tax=Peribacillus saganii TaxID=2303992 RepID=A0A372LQR3_9BACI|nr:Gfo/Idh/MocA family oxidoreductase [Peribacillus saganii]RFU69867.1 gfo/Idh/MocA family oxidoreductase [Peribacillus saganii]